MANLLSCGALVNLCPALKHWGARGGQIRSAPQVGRLAMSPLPSEGSQTPHGGGQNQQLPINVSRYEAFRTTQGCCGQSAHLWATSDFVPRFDLLGTRVTAVVA